MHLKNRSVLYPDGRTPTLAPAYDFLSTIPCLPDDTAALKYSRTKKMAEVTKDELVHLAAKAKLSEKLAVDVARETIDRFSKSGRLKKPTCRLPRMFAMAWTHMHPGFLSVQTYARAWLDGRINKLPLQRP